MTRAELEELQLERLNGVWQHAIAHVPHYQSLDVDLGLPKRFTSLAYYAEAVPVLHKPTVAADPAGFLSDRPEAGFWKRTGGSTGRPMKVYWGEVAHREVLAARYRYYQAWDIDFTDRSVMLWGNSGALQPGWKGLKNRARTPIEDRLRRRLRLSTYELSDAALVDYLRRIERFGPATLYGYSSSVHLLAKAAENGFDCPQLQLVTLTGEPSFQYIRDAVERGLGATPTQEYGAAEAPIIASEMPDGTLRVREDLVYVETIPQEGGRHSIVVSVLNNPSFPLLRYEMGDLSNAALATPANGFAVLDSVAGRIGDFVITGSGTPMHLARMDAFFKYQVPGVRRFRLRQKPDGAVRVMVEADSAAFDSRLTSRKLSDLLEGRAVTIEIVDAIPTSAAGKHRLVVSDFEPTEHREAAPSTGGTPPIVEVSHPTSEQPDSTASPRAARLRRLIDRPELAFIMEAHSGLSARVVEEAGFEAIWASGLSMSAALGVRDSNEASWTQVLEVLEFMSDASSLPILVDADT
jgi:phenylacetate-coenzyme A ligase PaaK-like adenylate-forming protein